MLDRARRAASSEGYRFVAVLRGARRDRLRRRRRARDHRSDRRLAERQARDLPSTRCRSPSPTGETMADVAFGFVYDFGPSEQWWAWRGEGAWLERRPARSDARRAPRTRRPARGARASSPPTRAGSPASIEPLERPPTACARSARSPRRCVRWPRARFDGMVSLRRSRGVDAAAGQLIVREAGGLVSFPWCDEPLGGAARPPSRARR